MGQNPSSTLSKMNEWWITINHVFFKASKYTRFEKSRVTIEAYCSQIKPQLCLFLLKEDKGSILFTPLSLKWVKILCSKKQDKIPKQLTHLSYDDVRKMRHLIDKKIEPSSSLIDFLVMDPVDGDSYRDKRFEQNKLPKLLIRIEDLLPEFQNFYKKTYSDDTELMCQVEILKQLKFLSMGNQKALIDFKSSVAPSLTLKYHDEKCKKTRNRISSKKQFDERKRRKCDIKKIDSLEKINFGNDVELMNEQEIATNSSMTNFGTSSKWNTAGISALNFFTDRLDEICDELREEIKQNTNKYPESMTPINSFFFLEDYITQMNFNYVSHKSQLYPLLTLYEDINHQCWVRMNGFLLSISVLLLPTDCNDYAVAAFTDHAERLLLDVIKHSFFFEFHQILSTRITSENVLLKLEWLVDFVHDTIRDEMPDYKVSRTFDIQAELGFDLEPLDEGNFLTKLLWG